MSKKVEMESRGADHYCLSWQLFFILTICIGAMIFIILGTSIMINVEYNPFKDVTATLVVLFWFCFVNVSIWLIQTIGRKINFDNWAEYENNSNNLNAIADYSLK